MHFCTLPQICYTRVKQIVMQACKADKSGPKKHANPLKY